MVVFEHGDGMFVDISTGYNRPEAENGHQEYVISGELSSLHVDGHTRSRSRYGPFNLLDETRFCGRTIIGSNPHLGNGGRVERPLTFDWEVGCP